MTGPAGGRPTESAAFDPVRVTARRARPPLVVFGVIAVFASIVAVGVGGQARPVATAPAAAAASPQPTLLSVQQSRLPAVPTFLPDIAPIVTSGPGVIQIQARRDDTTMFVHGDIYLPHVTWVFLSLQDDAGWVAGWASVSVPGAVGPAASDGPSLRFDVEMAIQPAFTGRLWIQVQAYDADALPAATTRVEVPWPPGYQLDPPATPASPSRPGPHGQFLASARPS